MERTGAGCGRRTSGTRRCAFESIPVRCRDSGVWSVLACVTVRACEVGYMRTEKIKISGVVTVTVFKLFHRLAEIISLMQIYLPLLSIKTNKCV